MWHHYKYKGYGLWTLKLKTNLELNQTQIKHKKSTILSYFFSEWNWFSPVNNAPNIMCTNLIFMFNWSCDVLSKIMQLDRRDLEL